MCPDFMQIHFLFYPSTLMILLQSLILYFFIKKSFFFFFWVFATSDILTVFDITDKSDL